MKIYNIEDTRRFFEVLSECSGDVEVIGRDGSMIPVRDKEVIKALEAACSGASIPEMELKCSSPEDSRRILCFLASSRIAA